jgi:hypothetical protein
MKTILFTQDYEIFFGKNSGTVNKCMILPNAELIDLFNRYNCTMTVFWDVLHFHTLKIHVKEYPELQKDIDLIENQIKLLIKNNHDIQLHIHPHWLDAKYSGNRKWHFTYERYDLHDLSREEKPDDINTIAGCVNTSVQVLKSFVDKKDSRIIFRAGGNHVEPFDALSKVFTNNSIFIDSSRIDSKQWKSRYTKPYYRFSESPSQKNNNGSFIEFPITTVNIGLFRKLLFKSLKKKYSDLDKFGDGNSIYESKIDKKLLETKFKYNKHNFVKKAIEFIKSKEVILTTEGSFKEKINYLIKKSPNMSLMTLHPKYINKHQLEILEHLLKNKRIHFISISEYINQYGID